MVNKAMLRRRLFDIRVGAVFVVSYQAFIISANFAVSDACITGGALIFGSVFPKREASAIEQKVVFETIRYIALTLHAGYRYSLLRQSDSLRESAALRVGSGERAEKSWFSTPRKLHGLLRKPDRSGTVAD